MIRAGTAHRTPVHPVKLFPDTPPPGPFRRSFWRSPLRGPSLTAVLGLLLLVFLPVVMVTGFLSHAAYEPDLGRNAIVRPDIDLVPFDWPTWTYLYAVTQGLHVVGGIVLVPLLLAKLWSVIPRLFAWPPWSSPAQALERLTLLGLVGGAGFQFATGIVNAQLYYPFTFNFVVAHYYGAWVFTAAFLAHVVVKLPVALRARKVRDEVLDHVLVAPEPAKPTLSRRGFFGVVGLSSGALAVTWAGQSVGGPLRQLAVLGTRGGGQSFPVNKTAAAARVTQAMVGSAWRLRVGDRSYSRADLLAMPQHRATLPIACVEGWSTTQDWEGVRLRDLAPDDAFGTMTAVSLQPRGVLRQASLTRGQALDGDALLALKVNGEDLSMDHGFPARIIVPGLPGVHCTKWVGELVFA